MKCDKEHLHKFSFLKEAYAAKYQIDQVKKAI